jgi:TonB family protein
MKVEGESMIRRDTLVLLLFPVLLLAIPQARKPLTNNDVISMVKQGVGDSVIVQAIQAGETAFDTSPEERERLRAAGVSEDILKAMVAAEAGKASAKTNIPGRNGVSYPEPIKRPNPAYTEEARKARIEGILVLSAIIRKDGTVSPLKVVKGLGYGLDESAINTISNSWRFKPGTIQDGTAVDVQANIEVTFSLGGNPKIPVQNPLQPAPQQATPPAAAQQAAPPAAAPKPATPTIAPDQKAYMNANAIKDPEAKIAALEKWLVDYPDSAGQATVTRALFDTIVKNHPEQQAKILDLANKAVAKAPDALKPSMLNSFGSQLFDAGILLDDAAKFLAQGITLTEEQARRNKAPYQATLGRIYLKQGKLNDAERVLNEALKANPRLAAASLGMAELYEKRGDNAKALNAYIDAATTSKLQAASRKQLNALYMKSHNGSLAGLEDMLDKKYRDLNPLPFPVARFQPTPMRTERVVLTEIFTGSGCPPCVAADLAAELAMERFARDEMIVLMYHEHIPQPDPMTTPQTTARFRYYNGTGVPAASIDGVVSPGGGGTRDATRSVYDRFIKVIEKQLESPAFAQLKLGAVLDGNFVRVNAAVAKVSVDTADPKLHLVLVEQELRYTGENGVRFHPMAVRSLAGADPKNPGFSITSRDSQTFAWDFDLNAISAEIKKGLDDFEKSRTDGYTFNEKKHEINPKDLLVVAFVQDEKTKSVLQSAQITVNAASRIE